jgi:hypothetical protein
MKNKRTKRETNLINRKSEFISLYYDENNSLRSAAKVMDVNFENIRYWMHKDRWNLKARSKSNSQLLSFKVGRATAKKGKDNGNYKDGRAVGDTPLERRCNKYGITVEQYDFMIKAQNNKCAICKNEFTKTPSIDHCHNTSLVRGLLCSDCNVGIGFLKDNKEYLSNAIKYLK